MRETLHKWGIGKKRTERHWKRITLRTALKPLLTVRKLIKSPVLLPTLLQIYCIGLIGLVTNFLWVWAAICDPTIGAICGKN